jgi:mono/diheme cytochrome c family protein
MSVLKPLFGSRAAAWALWSVLALAEVAMAEVVSTAHSAGQQIYRIGLLSSGAPLRAQVEQDVALNGARAACANCHRRSGFGTVEGSRVVRPITAKYLFQPRQGLSLIESGAPGRPSSERPAYSDETLKRVLRDGVDPGGRTLSTLMPRYDLPDVELAALIQYLHTLSAEPPPGVSAEEIHFATLVTTGVPAPQRQALLGVLEGYFRDKNAETRSETRRGQRSVLGHSRVYRGYRKWRLHVWELSGTPETWGQQIERYYQSQPVYAVLGGVGRGRWQEVHAACERLALPCLFPNTDEAEVAPGDFFSLYFSRGLTQEAEVLAEHLRTQAGDAPRRIRQLYRTQDGGAVAAAALRRALDSVRDVVLQDQVLGEREAGGPDFWRVLLSGQEDALVLWLRDADLAGLPAAPVTTVRSLYVSASLLAQPATALPEALLAHRAVVQLYELPARWKKWQPHNEQWLATHGLESIDARVQSGTLLVLSLVNRAMLHMREDFSREYLIEHIEHLVQTGSWPSVYPQLSLGPGQRIAWQGGYVVPLRPNAVPPTAAERIVPSTAKAP